MKIENLYFSYGDKKIFRGLSLDIPDAGITALTGASGCGKTTLLRLIAGLEKPESGVIIAPDPGDISFMFQEDRLLPGQSAARQLKIAVPGCDPSYYIDAVGLKGEENTLSEKMSGGMKRRLALARALCYSRDKKLLILDEPFTGVDPERIRSLMMLIRELKIPVIMSAHVREAIEESDQIVDLNM